MSKKRGNGEGSIYYSESKKLWIAQFSAGYTTDGKLKRKTIYGKTRKDVSQRLLDEQNNVKNRVLVDKSKITLHDIIKQLIDENFESNNISESSYRRNMHTLEVIDKMYVSKMPIQSITPEDLNESLLIIKKYSNSVISKAYGLLKRGYNRAILKNILSSSPFNVEGLIIKPKSERKTKIIDSLTIDEQKTFVKQLDNKDYAYKEVFIILLYTGMRVGEVLALTKDDIDIENKEIHIRRTLTKDKYDNVIVGSSTKTYAGNRTIPITPFIFETISNLLLGKRKDDYLFTYHNRLIAPSTINSHFKKICKDGNIRNLKSTRKKIDRHGILTTVNINTSKVNTHMLRHTYATRCIEAGMSPVVLQKLLGHKDIETTLNTYTSVFNKYKNDEISKVTEYLNNLNCG